MAAYVFDSSAIVKHYVKEAGSSWVNGVIRAARMSGGRVHIARITGVEIVSAIARRQRGGSLTPAETSVILTRFRRDLTRIYRSVAISPRLIEDAMALAEAYALRGYDAVQLAAALRVNARRILQGSSAITLISADAELNAAAVAEGLAVDDPNAHP